MRRAINGKLREESKDYPGYFKYEFEIKEEDGSITKIPAYGIDMQDALSRIVRHERIKRVKKVIKVIPDWAFLLSWFLYLSGAVFLGQSLNQPTFTITGLILPFVVFIGFKMWGGNKMFKNK